MLAASTCPSVVNPATFRVNALVRGSTAWIVPPSSLGAMATQSPTAGSSERSPALCRRRPVISHHSSPASV
jgi:hypothetical protein